MNFFVFLFHESMVTVKFDNAIFDEFRWGMLHI